jgi:selenide,water dikinase
MMQEILLTQYSHGAGCGCKIAPQLLEQILHSNTARPDNQNLIVGNHSSDDAAVYNLGNGTALISTTDFFMPIVDDAFSFGRIAAANAISDVYAMGGNPILAIAILGWPINTIPAGIAQRVIEGARHTCQEAGITLAGGHSIDSPEPIFGLAVNGLVPINHIKQNNTAQAGDLLLLTKPIGVGILTTAEKKGLLRDEHRSLAAAQMMQLNKVGAALGAVNGVTAMTDVTGFGLLGHLCEMAGGSALTARISLAQIPFITPGLDFYLAQKAVPGGTGRNWGSYGHKVKMGVADEQRAISLLSDPQTSGGLLVSVRPDAVNEVQEIFQSHALEKFIQPIGQLLPQAEYVIEVNA